MNDVSTPTVVLLHGLARSARSLRGMRRHIERAGYPTWARSYPSRRQPIEALASTVAGWIHHDLGDGPVIGVTHSLGGILVRHMNGLLRWRGLVMVAPPNNGSQVAATVGHRPIFRWFFGPAGQQVGAPGEWPLPPEPFTVIAGTRALALSNPTSWLTRGLAMLPRHVPSDGTVTVAETRLPQMSDFATVDANHTFILDHPTTRELVLGYLDRFATP